LLPSPEDPGSQLGSQEISASGTCIFESSSAHLPRTAAASSQKQLEPQQKVPDVLFDRSCDSIPGYQITCATSLSCAGSICESPCEFHETADPESTWKLSPQLLNEKSGETSVESGRCFLCALSLGSIWFAHIVEPNTYQLCLTKSSLDDLSHCQSVDRSQRQHVWRLPL
jgi:hypothetical protein